MDNPIRKLILVSSVSFTGEFSLKFRPRKYDFDLYKAFFMGKMTQIRQILILIFFKSLDFYDKFQYVAKNIERLLLFILSYVILTKID